MPPRRSNSSVSAVFAPSPRSESPVNALFAKDATTGCTTASKTRGSTISRKRPSSPETGMHVQSNGKRTSMRAKGDMQDMERGPESASDGSKTSRVRRMTRARMLANEVNEEEPPSRISGCNRISTRRAGCGLPPVAPTQFSTTTARQRSTAKIPPSEENMFQRQTPELRKAGPLSLLKENNITPVTQSMVAKNLYNPTSTLRSSARLKKLNISCEQSVNDKKSSSDLQPNTLKRARKNLAETSTAEISVGVKTRKSNSLKALEIFTVEGDTPIPNVGIPDPGDRPIHSIKGKERKYISVKSTESTGSRDSEDHNSKQPTETIQEEGLQEQTQEKLGKITQIRRTKPACDSARMTEKTKKLNTSSESNCLSGNPPSAPSPERSRDASTNQRKDGSKVTITSNMKLKASPKNRRKNLAKPDSSITESVTDRDKDEAEKACDVPTCVDAMRSSAFNISHQSIGDELIRLSIDTIECEDKHDKMPSKRKRTIGRKTAVKHVSPSRVQRIKLPSVIEDGEEQNQESECIDENTVVHTEQLGDNTDGKLESKSQARDKRTVTRKRQMPNDAHDTKRLKASKNSCKHTPDCAREVSEKGDVKADDVTNVDDTIDHMLDKKVRKKDRKSRMLLFDALPVGFGLGVSGWHHPSLLAEIVPNSDLLQLVAEKHGNNQGPDHHVLAYNKPEHNDSDKYSSSIRCTDEQIPEGSTNILTHVKIANEASNIMKGVQIAEGAMNVINNTPMESKQETTNKPRKRTKSRRAVIKSPETLVKDDDTGTLNNDESQPIIRRSSRNRK